MGKLSYLFLFALLIAPDAFSANAKTKKLWSEWYLYTISSQVQGYYKEELEERSGEKQLALSQNWTEKENGTTQTYIGAVSKQNEAFTPVAFYVERKSDLAAISVDARVKDNKVALQLKTGDATKKLEFTNEKGMIWGTFLSILIAKSKKFPLTFSAMVEDSRDGDFQPQLGRVTSTKESKKIHNESCQKYQLSYRDMASDWWITKAGKVCEVYIAKNDARIVLSSKNDAEKAFQGAN